MNIQSSLMTGLNRGDELTQRFSHKVMKEKDDWTG